MDHSADLPRDPAVAPGGAAPLPARPVLLGIGSVLSMFVGAGFLIGAFSVLSTPVITLDGRVMRGGETAFVVATLVLVGATLIAVGYGFFKHRMWARPAALGVWVGASALLLAWARSVAELALDVVWVVLVVGGVWWSFYRKRSVVAYYAAVRAVERTGGSYSEVAAARPKGWWRRNWKWFVLAYLAFVVILVLVVEVSLRRSDPYTGAMRLANADPQVVAALGTPVEAGMLLTGEIESSVSAKRVSGHASFQIPLHGPRGSGELSVAALRDSSGWKYTRMIFRAKGRSDTLVWAPAASGRADTTSAR